jgi:hypothetical protein
MLIPITEITGCQKEGVKKGKPSQEDEKGGGDASNSDPDLIWIQLDLLIRIRIGNPDPDLIQFNLVCCPDQGRRK